MYLLSFVQGAYVTDQVSDQDLAQRFCQVGWGQIAIVGDS
jgi:hypothetical protein